MTTINLTYYTNATQTLLHDFTGAFYGSPFDLTAAINRARRRVAERGQCVRVLPTGNNTVQAQEVYPFSTVNALIAAQSPGVGSIVGVNSIAVSWGTTKPVLERWTWQELQAYGRAVQNTFQNYPYVWAQYAQGDFGSVYLWPIPSGAYQMDWDCICTVLDLNSDSDPEALPQLWSEPVPYYAAYVAYQYAQRMEDAREMFNEYVRKLNQARENAEMPQIPDMYGSGYYA